MAMKTRERPLFQGLGPTRWGHPNEGVHNRLAYRVMEEVLLYAAGRYARGRLIDVGCGSKPWKGLFEPFVDEHVGVDLVPSKRNPGAVDLVASAYEIPLDDASADTVLLTAVLEHLEEPHRAFAEARRLLRPGGYVIVTAPFIWPLHDQPRDFFRYSPHALRFLLESAGFEIVELQPVAGVWKTLALEISYALRRYRKGAATPVVDGMTRAVQWLGARWELVDFQPKFSWSHLAVARAPGGNGAGSPS
jgi:SAM-dependent methyltransferase